MIKSVEFSVKKAAMIPGWYVMKTVQRVSKKGKLITEYFHASDVSDDREEIESLYIELRNSHQVEAAK